MLYCEQCKVEITGKHTICPLCHCELKGTQKELLSEYPLIIPQKTIFDIVPKLMRFVAITACIISVLIDFVLYKDTMWSIFVVVAVIGAWISLEIGLPMRSNLMKVLQNELYILCILSIICDYFSGWEGWSISTVIPIATTVCMIFMGMLALAFKKHTKDYLSYLLTVDLIGFATGIIIFIDSIEVNFLAVICVCTSCVFLTGIVIFERNLAVRELQKKLHL